jgi:hypothetical protein
MSQTRPVNGAANYSASATQAVGAVGDTFGWNEDFDPQIKTGVKTPVTTPGTMGTIVAVRRGSIDISTPDGRIQTLTSWQGKPVTQDVLHADGTVMTQLASGLPTHWDLQKNGTQVQRFELAPGTTSESDARATASAIMKQYAQSAQSGDVGTRQAFVNLQDRLIKAGLLSKDQYVRGLPDDYTQKALHDALVMASRGDTTLDEVLATAASSVSEQTKSKATRNIQLTSPETIQAAVRGAAPGILGRGADPTMMSSLAAQYNALETQQQNAVADATDANTGQGTTSVTYNQPSVSDFVSQRLRASDPTAAQGMALGHYLSEFMALLGSGGAGSPSTFGGANG